MPNASEITFLSQFPNNAGSGVCDYTGLLCKQLYETHELKSEIRSWNNSRPNWQSLLKSQQKTSILSIQFVPYSFGRWGFFLPFLRELVRVKDQWDVHFNVS